MIKVESNVVLKYCPGVDRFLKIRSFRREEVGKLLQFHNIRDRKSYRELIVNACIVNYNDEIVPALRAKATEVGQREETDEQLYQACIEINPDLEISRVVLPLSDPAESVSELHLFDPESPPPAEEFQVEGIEAALQREVVGQREAVHRVSAALKRAAAGLRDPERPIGSFFFVGQTGVGKTELARALARNLWPGPSHLMRVDCSEYAQGHEYAKLIGAPPGYIGHGEGGQLTERMKRLGRGVVLFDEIEKADPKLHNVLLQLLDEGALTDGKGTRVAANRIILILTSNLGVREVEELALRIGFHEGAAPVEEEARRREILAALKREFPPEFINRIDEIVFFNVLGLRESVRIVEIQLTEVSRRVADRGIRLRFTPRLSRWLAECGFDTSYGARNLRREISRRIEGPLAELILDRRIGPGDRVCAGVRGEHVYFRREN